MIIKAKIDYRDLQLNKDINAGDEYEVSEERGKQIVDADFAVEVKPKTVTVTKSDKIATTEAAKAPSDACTDKPDEQPATKPKRARKPKTTE